MYNKFWDSSYLPKCFDKIFISIYTIFKFFCYFFKIIFS